ncbi:MAG: phosphonate metabolism protein/1,5-bisphosphokinase (PRPP-forming) PhnN [Gammaproteobacteria bacterium]|nr:phosphonate metabolism protein/1,5-bisphosphokinase (PRPP-forming) PhnN [Gammaproteobacteria bacterium]MCP5136273.1 phosphonate metabolism protein/1,5-bisphosphokinase (PRPP-forming) PhnN [Gammaproteobacteria bacterium]
MSVKHDSANPQRGRLVYLIGASGSGKDSLMRYARSRLADQPVLFAHRYITRAVHDGAEDHIVLSAEEFACRRDAGLFALHWQAHGFDYGIGIELDLWRARGMTVVVNGARRHLPSVRQSYPDADVVWVSANQTVRAVRLTARARETTNQIRDRLSVEVGIEPASHDAVINNNGPIELAGDALVAFLMRVRGGVQAPRVNGV